MSAKHVTENNPNGSVQQCNKRGVHGPHEHQEAFGSYWDVYCPGVKGLKPKKLREVTELVDKLVHDLNEHNIREGVHVEMNADGGWQDVIDQAIEIRKALP